MVQSFGEKVYFCFSSVSSLIFFSEKGLLNFDVMEGIGLKDVKKKKTDSFGTSTACMILRLEYILAIKDVS